MWSQKCLQAFGSAAPGHGLDACLWSLTEVFKRLLKGAHGGTVFAPLNSLLVNYLRLMRPFVTEVVCKYQIKLLSSLLECSYTKGQ